jgi:iron complex outermembrane receptor protein
MSGFSLRGALLLGTAVVFGLALAPLAKAQTAVQATPAQQQFDIPTQSLAAALDSFARSSGWQVGYPAALAQGKTSSALRGRFTPTDALTRLLQGTGLAYRVTGTNTVTLAEIPQGSSATVLPPVVAEGQVRPETAYGPVDGYVATRSATGSKTDTPVLEMPQSVSVITREQMAAQGVQSLEQALAYTPGVMAGPFGDDSRYDQFNLRGFTGTTNASYLDGLRQWGAFFAFPQNEPYGLEKIGVIRGPASVLYGQIAPGGLVESVSKRPTSEPLHEVILQGGSNDHMQGQFDLGGPVDESGRVLYRLTGLLRDAETELDAPNDRRFIAPALTLRNDSTSLTLLSQYQEFNTGNWPYYYNANGNVSRVWLGDPNFNNFNLVQYHIGYLFEHSFNETWKVRQNFRYGRVELDTQYVDYSSLSGSVVTRYAGIANQDLTNYAVDNQVQADFETGSVKHTALAGIGYDRMYYDYRGGEGAAPSLNLNAPVYGQSVTAPAVSDRSRQTQEQLGAYLQEQARIGQVALTLGGRWDRAQGETKTLNTGAYSRQDDMHFTGKAGLVYLFDNGLAPYVSYAESFLPTSGTSRLGAAFKPQTGSQTELGVKYQAPGHSSFVSLAVFDLIQENVLTTDPANSNFSIQTGEVTSRGLEFEAKAALSESLNLIGSYTYTDAEVTSSTTNTLGKSPTAVPSHMAGLWADYGFVAGFARGLRIGGGLRYIGSTYANDTNTRENAAHVLTDAMLRYDLSVLSPDLRGIEAGLNATNLFDRDVSFCNGSTCSWLAGRTVMGSLRYRW